MNSNFSQNNLSVIYLTSIDSTNSYANNLLSKTNPIEGTVIRADFQTQGRGQIGRYWYSKEKMNLLLSMILYPHFLPIQSQFLLSKMVSCAICKLLNSYGLENVKIKWPNDIYINDNKIAGILIQNQLQGSSIKNSIVGVGINVNQDEWPYEIPNPTSLKILKGVFTNIDDLLIHTHSFLIEEYQILASRQIDQINSFYHSNLYKLNTPHLFYQEEETFEGIIEKVLDNGQILIVSKGMAKTYNFREISFFKPTI